MTEVLKNARPFFVSCLLALAIPWPASSQPAAVDFKNFTYRTHPCSGNVPVPAVVKNGTFSYFDKKMGQGFDINVFAIVEGSLRPGTQQAVVTLACDFPIGGTSAAYLFAIHGKDAKLIAKVADADWGGDWGIGPRAIRAQFANGIVTITGCAIPDCTNTTLVRYGTRNGQLVKLESKTISQRGSDAGTKLVPYGG